jgi:hypothetical protein
MPRKAKADMTHAQRVTLENNKFRNQIYAEHLDQYEQLKRSDDLDKFRQASYRQALRDAKATRP